MKLTLQQVFDNALNGIRAQNYAIALDCDGGDCAYRAKQNRDSTVACLVGHSIPNSEYLSAMDEAKFGGSVIDLIEDRGNLWPRVAELFSGIDAYDLMGLQKIHDKYEMVFDINSSRYFETKLAGFAAKHSLTFTPLPSSI